MLFVVSAKLVTPPGVGVVPTEAGYPEFLFDLCVALIAWVLAGSSLLGDYVLRGKGQYQLRLYFGGEKSLTRVRAACSRRRPIRRSPMILFDTSMLREASLSTRPLIPLTSVPIYTPLLSTQRWRHTIF